MRNQTASVHDELSQDAVREQLERILASADFIIPVRGRRLLHFLVTEALEGRANRLKAYTIAQEVFGRDVNFDAQNDPCVRIAASQLRRALERYYLTAGASDELVITVPAGGYVPSMALYRTQLNADSQAANVQGSSTGADEVPMQVTGPPKGASMLRLVMIGAGIVVVAAVLLASYAERDNPALKEPVTAGEKPTIVVQKFWTDSDSNVTDEDLDDLKDNIIINLTKTKSIAVFDGTGRGGNATYSLQGSLRREGEGMKSVARLVRTVDGAVTWAGDYNVDLRGRSILDVEAAIARSISAAIAAPFDRTQPRGEFAP